MGCTNMKSGKSRGVDNVTAEEIYLLILIDTDVFFRLLTILWNREEMPQEWSRSVIIPIFEKKGKIICDNYRGISLLCHAEKLFASILLHRIRKRTEEILSESQVHV